MTLIEILFNYREILREKGREAADSFLHDTCEISLHWHIKKSVHGKGYFLKADGTKFDPSEWK
jgi:hypothetical protein